MTSLHLGQSHFEIIAGILKKNLGARQVIAFGSRVTGKHKPHSDLDLCIMGNEALTISQMAHLKEDFSESTLPFRVDIVDWASLSPDFQKIIKQSFIELVY
jgi:predicted nucleotidyltransferase